MATQRVATKSRSSVDAREQLLAGIPATQRRELLAGVSTAVLEGGDGPPLLLLHGPAANATHWMRVIPELAKTHRVIAPDLPGHGESQLTDDGELDAERVFAWLGELIERTCPSPPVLVGHALGGAIAAHFAVDHGDRLSRLVLVDALGLTAFEPAPEFGLALNEFLAQPTEHTHDDLWRRCALDLDSLRERMGERWDPFEAYNLDRAQTPSVMAALGSLMARFGGPPISAAELERIAVPTTLIWGRHDLATALSIAEAASDRYGWSLQVIEACADDPPIEQPAAFVQALRTAVSVPHPSGAQSKVDELAAVARALAGSAHVD
jgi:pimeloyl-ACP methyl ester carboxylesterase